MSAHSYRCQSCGRSVSLGATCGCNVVLADDRIAAALERIATALETLAAPPTNIAIDGDAVLAASRGQIAP